MLYGNFGPNWRPRGWLPGDKVPRGWLPGDKPPVARTQPATTSATTSTISGSRTVAPPATTSTIAGARTVAPLATTSTTARTQPATASATNSTIAGARPEAPPATTSMVAGSRTVAQPANTTTVARTQPVTASATTSTTTGSQPATASTTTSTIAGARTVAPPATTSTTTDSHPEALPATTSMTTGARPIATPIGRTTFAGTRPAAPSANTTTTAHTQPQNNGPGQRALPRQDRKRHCKAGIEPLPEPPVNDEDTYGIHGSQELDDFKKKYLGLVENYPPARDLYLNLFSRRQRLGTRLVTDDTLRVDRIYYALLCLAIDRAVRCNSLDRLEDLFALLLEANDEVILSRYIRERRQETIHDID
ncbi:hypothetical protein GGI16_008425 [Coemansia sp. S142-1]|nr:hypothetical protein GGI16_008425 [Coemansia sp. S142-1]